MKNLMIAIISLLFSISCSTKNAIETKSIQIERIEQHPFLVDHCKQLNIYNRDGILIDKVKIYCDSGVGCNSYLFDTYKTYTIIDCNGSWYSIDKRTGKIAMDGWKWEDEIPAKYVGTFVRDQTNGPNKLIEQEITKKDIYQFKDPND